MPGHGHVAADDTIEPYYVAKVTRDDPRPVEINSADGAVPPLPCTFESITPALVTGVLGYILGAGRRSISMIFNKQARGFAGLNREGFTSAKNFAVLSFSYSLPLCILKRIRDKDDWKNHTAAGVLSGFVISWGNGPINMLGSSLLLGAISGYLSRSDPTVAHAASVQTMPNIRDPEGLAQTTKTGSRRHRARCQSTMGMDKSPAGGHGDLLSCAASCINADSRSGGLSQSRLSRWEQSGSVAASAVWSAIKPGCRSCTIQHDPKSAVPHPAPASLPGARRQPRGLWPLANRTRGQAASSACRGDHNAP